MQEKKLHSFVPSIPQQETVSSANLSSLWIVVTSVILAGSGQLVFKAALNGMGELNLSLEMFLQLATNPLLLLGLGIYGLSALLWLLALMRAELSFAYSFLSLSYLIVLLGGGLFFHEPITGQRLPGFVLIILGIFIVARSEARHQE